MSTLAHYLTEQQHIWDEVAFTSDTDVCISEIWQLPNAAGTQWSFTESKDLAPKVSTTTLINSGSTTRQLRLRVYWLPYHVKQRSIALERNQYTRLLRDLKLDLATAYSGIGRLNETETSVAQYYFSLHPKARMTWRADRDGIVHVVCVAEDKKIDVLKDLLSKEFFQTICEEETMPALLCAVLLALEVEKSQDEIKKQVRQVEVRTGHHDWKSRKEGAALGDLTSLSAKMSGCSTRCGSGLRKAYVLIDVLDFVDTQLASMVSGAHDRVKERRRKILDMVQILRKRAKVSIGDNEFIQRRVDIQLNALYHLVAQNDAFLGQQMASDCRLVAIASQRDSSSMKVIAFVTMCFLPATVVATVFSIPLFDWEAETRTDMIRREFWFPKLVVYLAVTFPLMALTFAIWGLWLFAQTIKDKKRAVAIRAQLGLDAEKDEAQALALRRATLRANSMSGE
ncbi:hypothetical protein LTR64_002329 [Lithohypha guttulata]|uniref:uncharacterized protein n=1 Tax=Lithohypha guttulata TaxID=1690604 RepID=UPI002DE175F2|nr:hypothetical protein LTR51_001445 [Lithohypha guttulata]